MNPNQTLILDVIAKNPGIRPSQIRALTDLPKRTLTWHLAKLKAKGHAKARLDIRDGRLRCYYTMEVWSAIKQRPKIEVEKERPQKSENAETFADLPEKEPKVGA